MAHAALIGIFEIAELAEVSPSAVANWRKRFPDFPAPIVDLKSGPVFDENKIKLWLAKRAAQANDNLEAGLFYDQLASNRGDSAELRAKVEEVVENLVKEQTSTGRPGMLLGKVQSGKTRAFLGVIARAFDKGFEVAIIMTKGTKSLAAQTLSRVKEDFEEFISADKVQVFDILAVPELTPYELGHRLVFVVKKEDDNLWRLLNMFEIQYPQLQQRSIILIDDEADLASVSYRRINGINTVGVISQQIDKLRNMVTNLAFLQVTATPYSLYLQPEDEVIVDGNSLFRPKRPAFTVLLPSHNKYVGGDEYFEKSTDSESPAFYFYREVPLLERDALKKEDRRRLEIDKVLTDNNSAVLRDAVVTFLVGGAIRRLQQKSSAQKIEKYSFLFHTEYQTNSHEWQERVATAIRDSLVDEAQVDSPLFNELLRSAYTDLKRSIEIEGTALPLYEEVKKAVVGALAGGQLMITKVNKDKDIKKLLDDEGQLKLRTPFNIFIGGQILDRGVTINNLIAFYYGRNPNRFQQDTVLQHSRMYGARSIADLAVTRFYAPQHVYQIMKRIHEFDGALREAFITGAHDKGVYFIRKDARSRLIPCSPNKLLFSDVVSIRPGKRLLMVGFQTVSKTAGKKNLQDLDAKIDQLISKSKGPHLVDIDQAVELLQMAYSNLEFDNSAEDDREAHIVALEHLSKICKKSDLKGKVWLIVARDDRGIRRYREGGRFSNAPDTKQQKDLARSLASDVPVLMLLRQKGDEAQGWRGIPFWWPVILTPQSGVTVIFSTAEVTPSDSANPEERVLFSEVVDNDLD
jgi:hypothetical protein